MPPVTMAYTIQLALHGALDGREFYHVLNFHTPENPPSNAHVINVAQWAYTALLPQLRLVNSPHVTWIEAVAKNMAVAGGYGYTQPFITGNVGNRGTTAAPANAAGVVNWKTSGTGRKYNGKTFLGAFDIRDVDNSVLQNAIMILLNALVQWIFTHPPVAGVLFSVGSPTGHFSTPVTGYNLNNSVDDIGRRLIGHGE